MANDYAAGSAASWSDLRTAIENFLVLNGWAAAAGTGNNRLYTKSGMAVRLNYTTTSHTKIEMFGGTGVSGTALVNECPIGAAMINVSGTTISFPIDYELYWLENPEEFYVVINYNGDKYQHLHWGKSDIPGIGGTGMWYYGTYQAAVATPSTLAYFTSIKSVATGNAAGTGDFYTTPYSGGICGGFFMMGESAAWAHAGGINCELEGSAGWKYTSNNSGEAGILALQRQSTALLHALPSAWNEAEVLLPIYVGVHRTGSPGTIAAVLRHARLMRIDNVSPEDIITYGSDQWKVYPLIAKNVAARNGVAWNTGAAHSGTVGVAIRYPGP